MNARKASEERVSELLASFDFATTGPESMRDLLEQAWIAGAQFAVVHDWDESELDVLLNIDDEQDALCGATYTTGGSDPYGTDCDQPAGHYKYGTGTKHAGPDPMGGAGRILWNGGGSCAGDLLPYRDVEYVEPAVKTAEIEADGLVRTSRVPLG